MLLIAFVSAELPEIVPFCRNSGGVVLLCFFSGFVALPADVANALETQWWQPWEFMTTELSRKCKLRPAALTFPQAHFFSAELVSVMVKPTLRTSPVCALSPGKASFRGGPSIRKENGLLQPRAFPPGLQTPWLGGCTPASGLRRSPSLRDGLAR